MIDERLQTEDKKMIAYMYDVLRKR